MAPRILLCYHSKEGQTAKVARRIAEVLRARGCEVVSALAEDDPAASGFDGVVMGDSIHAGQHSREMHDWVRQHAEYLRLRPVALFQVSLTSAGDDEASVALAVQMVHDLIDGPNIEPDVVGMFAGALVYTKYGWLKRTVMRRIAAGQGADTDTKIDHEYTDWDAVEHFAADAAALFVGADHAPAGGVGQS